MRKKTDTPSSTGPEANASEGVFEALERIRFLEHHRCGGCNSPVGYEIHPEYAAIVFQSGCDCGGTYPNYRLVDRSELLSIRDALKAEGRTPPSVGVIHHE